MGSFAFQFLSGIVGPFFLPRSSKYSLFYCRALFTPYRHFHICISGLGWGFRFESVCRIHSRTLTLATLEQAVPALCATLVLACIKLSGSPDQGLHEKSIYKSVSLCIGSHLMRGLLWHMWKLSGDTHTLTKERERERERERESLGWQHVFSQSPACGVGRIALL